MEREERVRRCVGEDGVGAEEGDGDDGRMVACRSGGAALLERLLLGEPGASDPLKDAVVEDI